MNTIGDESEKIITCILPG